VTNAFIVATGLSLASAAFCLLLGREAHGGTSHPDHDEHHDAASASDKNGPKVHSLAEPPKSFNALDRFARHWVCRNAQYFVRRLSGGDQAMLAILARCFYDVVIALGDLQLVMGIAIMMTALIRMQDGEKPLSTHHFIIVNNLIWFSSNAHLLALLLMRNYDESAKPGSLERKDKARTKKSAFVVRAVRVLLMCVLAVMLLCSSVLLGDENLNGRLPCPAVCLSTSDDEKGGEPKQWMIVNIFYVVYNYPVAFFVLSRTLRRLWMERVSRRIHQGTFLDGPRTRPVRGLLPVSKGTSVGGKLPATAALREIARRAGPIVFIVKWILYSVWTLLSSELLNFVEVGVWYSLEIGWNRDDRNSGQQLMELPQRYIEDAWGFGQLMPLFLLILPFMRFFESYAAYSCEQERLVREESRPMDARNEVATDFLSLLC